MRTSLIVLLLAVAAGASGEPQIDWAPSWKAAFEQAASTGRPVMVCINSKDGESANEMTAFKTYRDPVFVALSGGFVMVLVSTRHHAAEGECPRFGRITCQQHLECWKDLKAQHGKEFCFGAEEMISPQHAWFAPDGGLLGRKEYFLSKSELLGRMRDALVAVGRSAGKDGAGANGAPEPLNDVERAALERLQQAEDPGTRAAALATLLASGKAAAAAALCDLTAAAKDPELRNFLLRCLAWAQVEGIRSVAEKLLADQDPGIRSCAAVTLETLALPASVPVLVRRTTLEDDPTVRKNVCRALGACGGPAADKSAARALLKVVDKDKQKSVSKHAALALRAFAGEGAKLVRKKLEQAALDAHDQGLQQACVYALAYVGDPKKTVAVLRKILEKEKDEWAQGFLRGAIARLENPHAGEKDAFGASATFLFWEDREDPARAE